MCIATSGNERALMKHFFKLIIDVVKATAGKWLQDKAPQSAAAVAFYTIFSLAPVAVVVVGVMGILIGEEAIRAELIHQVHDLIGPEGAKIVRTSFDRLNTQGGSIMATVVGMLILLFGATTVFAQLQAQLNRMWHVESKPGQNLLSFLRARLLSLGMILIIGFFLIVSLVVDATLSYVSNIAVLKLPGLNGAIELANFVFSLALITALFSAIFKYLPDVKLRWSDVWVGAALTALLFELGKTLIGIYLGRSAVVSAYGAAGSLVVVLLWVYYSAQILFFGAEFTQVYASKRGHPMPPVNHARKLD